MGLTLKSKTDEQRLGEKMDLALAVLKSKVQAKDWKALSVADRLDLQQRMAVTLFIEENIRSRSRY